MGWRRLGGRVAVVATAAAFVFTGTVVFVAFAGSGNGTGGSGDGGIAAFNGCVTSTRFLVLVSHGPGNGLVETIKDRVHEAVVGEVATDRAPTTLGGAAAGNDGYVMSTATPLGRDATAIERCWDRVFPIAP
jgi:hypothetical protein